MKGFEKLRKERQLFGNRQYGDADINRDKIKDAIEEVLDVKNILTNRLFYQLIKKFGYISQEVIEEVKSIMDNSDELIKSIKSLEEILVIEYEAEYTNIKGSEEVDRIGVDEVD